MNLQAIQDYFNYEPTFDRDPQYLVDKIKLKASTYLPPEKVEKIQFAYEYAKKAHHGQKRLSGEPYIVHPVRATEFLMHMKPGINTIQTCLLHDVIEDTTTDFAAIKKDFGEDVATLCEWLVKVSKVRYKWEDRQLETLKKTFLAMASDLRVIFVKIADRVHNIQTLKYHPDEEKRLRIADETMKIYVPIAKRLGLYHYQLYLENGCFFIKDYYECLRIVKYMEKNFWSDKRYIISWTKKIEKVLHDGDIEGVVVKWRVKSPYRIYQKMIRKYQETDVSRVMDMVAFRVITKTIPDCYHVLGVIHSHYTPLINKIKDYISLPKVNGYKSLHTTVVWMFSFPVEIQIRTKEMDDIAEYGVAAHFEYSEEWSEMAVSESQSQRIRRLQEVVEHYQNAEDKESFTDELSIEVLNKTKFLYTPKGDIVEMPHGSTVLDFAFRIHSDVGLRFKNAIVNGVIKPIGYIPKTGDIIDINTFRNKIVATQYWMDFLHTPSGKNKLLKHIKKEQRDMLIKESITKLNKKLKERQLPLFGQEWDNIAWLYPREELEKRLLLMLDKQESYATLFREAYPKQWWKRVKPKTKYDAPQTAYPRTEVIVDDDKKLPYTLCDMCKPAPWTKIIARSGKDGIKIHSLTCRWIKTISPEKLLEAHRWNEETTRYKVSVELSMKNTHVNLAAIIGIFADLQVPMDNISIKNDEHGDGYVLIDSDYSNPGKIYYLFNALKKHKNFITITRTTIS